MQRLLRRLPSFQAIPWLDQQQLPWAACKQQQLPWAACNQQQLPSAVYSLLPVHSMLLVLTLLGLEPWHCQRRRRPMHSTPAQMLWAAVRALAVEA